MRSHAGVIAQKVWDGLNTRVLRKLLDEAHDAIEITDPKTLGFIYVNEATQKMHGYTRDEFLTMSVQEIDPEIGSERLNHINKTLHEQRAVLFESTHRRKDSSSFPVEVHISLVRIDGKDWRLAVVRDITERRKNESRLELFHALLDRASDAIEVSDPETLQFLDINKTACRILGYTREELLALSVWDIDTDMEAVPIDKIKEALQKGQTVMHESFHRRKDGSTFPVEVAISQIQLDRAYNISVARDVTERKQTASLLKQANRALKLLSKCSAVLVRAESEKSFLSDVCRLAVETGGYTMAWIGLAEDGLSKAVRPIAQSGYEEGYLDHVSVTWADTVCGRGPTGTAIRTGKPVVNQDCLNNPNMAPWREAAIKRGYQSSIALPLFGRGRTMAALTIYAAEPYAFNEEETKLLQELTDEISYGIETLRARIEHEQHETILRESLEQSILAIADTVEARDPYTAGHQRRVGMLATAIAREMKLAEEQVQAISLASIIHDLGKIHIPAEILSKPGRLNEIEYEMIKMHPQAGYDIVKNVKFPWPIADIILQHHERLDGTGYPQGLEDGQIMLEARIIAVADVVESMNSHRPYREGLGVEAALAEIVQHRGTRYDPQVVDTCLKLFRQDGFVLSD